MSFYFFSYPKKRCKLTFPFFHQVSAGRGVPRKGTELVMAKEGQWLVVVEACRASSMPGPGVEGVGWERAPCGVMAGAVTSGNTGLTAAGLGIGNVTLSTRVRNLIVSVPKPTQTRSQAQR